MKGSSSLRSNLALLLLGGVVALLLLEGGVLLVFGEQPKFPRRVVGAEFGLRINEPNARYRHKSADVDVEFRINNRGLRADRDFPYDTPRGIQRIVSLGDSYTVGFEVDGAQTFSSWLERELRAQGRAVEVLNAGVSGYGTAEALLYLERELIRYDPDLVVLSFFGNDLVDNVRSGLFSLVGTELVVGNPSYVPAGRLGDLLNTNAALNLLSERSNAFALLKETATLRLKQRFVQLNLRQVEAAKAPRENEQDHAAYERSLASAILDRMYQTTSGRGIPLVIQSIPIRLPRPKRLVDLFPSGEFDLQREGVYWLPARTFLQPWLGRELLYYERSQDHWTPRSHELAGRTLAALILREGLLD